uniref:Phytase-like domain-containing protein n=2 Tax=Leptocylindrus danicus TaxID=163516 RepID=A0A7S2P2X5_9STRA
MCDEYVVVAFQRAWSDEEYVRIGMYNTETMEWKFGMYALDEPESPNGGWVGLSDISHVKDGMFLVLERDNQGGPDARIKKIYGIEIEDMEDFVDGTVIEKMFILDLKEKLLEPNGLVYEKVEGMAITEKGEVWIVNDNDGVDDNNGETQLLNLGKILKKK